MIQWYTSLVVSGGKPRVDEQNYIMSWYKTWTAKGKWHRFTKGRKSPSYLEEVIIGTFGSEKAR